MGLFENIQKKARKLGIANKAIQAMPYISLLAVVCGVAWLMALPVQGQYRNTYISENALLPAQATTYFRETEWHITRGYREEMHLLEHASNQTRSDKLVEWFEDIGLKTAKHEWELVHGDEKKGGTNVYGILHAPRGDNTEAMVMVAPWFNEFGEYNDGGVSLVVALARYFKKWSVWSKNIILVVTSDSQFAIREWVDAYHTSLENTAGAIEAAVVLDYPSKEDYFDHVELFYEGLNGQLPNLDLVNVARLIADHENVKVVIQGMDVSFSKYTERAKTLLKAIYKQVVCGIQPGPGGENFSGWKIDTLTLRAGGGLGPSDITHFGRLGESLFRSINNLLEHFHQSFFFYYLLTPKKFVSIGTFLPAAMLVANSFTIMAISILLKGDDTTLANKTTRPIAVLTTVFGGSILFGYITLKLPSDKTTPFIQAVSTLCFSLPYVLRACGSRVARFPSPVLQYLQAYSLIIHGLFLTTLATLHFALSFVIALATVSLAWVRPRNLQKFNYSSTLLTLSSPWTALLVLSYYNAYTKQIPWADAFEQLINGLLWGWRGLQVWTWGMITAVWLPVWIVAMIVAYL